MKILTKNTDYAVRALVYIGRNEDRFVSSREIAQKEGIPLQYIRRILQELTKRKFIITREGVKGGVKLSCDPKKVHLIDIIEIFQGSLQLIDCMFRKNICPSRARCMLRKKIKGIERTVADEFRTITIQSLMKDGKK